MAVPRVSVRISLRSPIRPREGTWNSRRTRPEPWFTILFILPLRLPSFSITTPDESLRAVDHQQFHRLMHLAVDGARQDLRLAHHQLVAFAPHHLDQDGELQLAAPHHLERIVAQSPPPGSKRWSAVPCPAGRAGCARSRTALPPGERRRVDGERHRDGRLVDLDVRQRLRILGAGDGLADGDAFHAGNRQNVARPARWFRPRASALRTSTAW